MNNGYTYGELKKRVIDRVNNNAISGNCMDELYRIYGLNPVYPWITRASLIQEISKSADRIALEEAARITVNSMICYDDYGGRYYVYG